MRGGSIGVANATHFSAGAGKTTGSRISSLARIQTGRSHIVEPSAQIDLQALEFLF
jgi:hypothetical protein